jgi:hypothetical protein
MEHMNEDRKIPAWLDVDTGNDVGLPIHLKIFMRAMN